MIAGCSKNESAGKAAALEQAFQKAPDTTAGNPAQRDDIRRKVEDAVSALKTNDYATAFISLKSLQSAPGINLDQYTAIQDARLAVERDVAAKALAGDPAAKQALQIMKGMGH